MIDRIKFIVTKTKQRPRASSISLCASLFVFTALCYNPVTGFSNKPFKFAQTPFHHVLKVKEAHQSQSRLKCTYLQSSSNSNANPDFMNIPCSARNARINIPLSSLPLIFLPSKALAASSEAFDSALSTYFPGALISSVIKLRLMATLRKKGYRPFNTFMATVHDGDEVIDTPESLITDMRQALCESRDGGVAHFGGFGGLPFNLESANVLASHCPKEGKVFIMFGPNVGISNDGKIGMVERIGSEGEPTNCGAGIEIYNSLVGKDSPSTGVAGLQKQYIVDKLKGSSSNLKGSDANTAVTAITRQLYTLSKEIINAQLDLVTTKPEFWSRIEEITLLGGIIVNRGHGSGTKGGEDYYQPLLMKSFSAKGETDLYGEAFGDLPTPRNL